MRKVDIQNALKADASTTFAAIVPWSKKPVEAAIHTFAPRRVLVEEVSSGDKMWIAYRNVLRTWGSYIVERDHSEAIAMDYERERAEECAVRSEWIRAFDGITVSGRDLGEHLREVFIDNYAAGSTFGPDVFAAIAQRLAELESLATGWVGGPTDTGVPEHSTLSVKRTIEEVEDALDSIKED